MTSYVLICSSNRFESPDAVNSLHLAKQLAEGGHNVAVFFVQNGVFAAAAADPDLRAAAEIGVRLLADEFALRERGVTQPPHSMVRAASLDFVVDRLAAGDKVIWQ